MVNIVPITYLGKGQLLSFRKDCKEYVLSNVSPNFTHVFVLRHDGRIFYKKIKDIVKINRREITIKI